MFRSFYCLATFLNPPILSQIPKSDSTLEIILIGEREGEGGGVCVSLSSFYRVVIGNSWRSEGPLVRCALDLRGGED